MKYQIGLLSLILAFWCLVASVAGAGEISSDGQRLAGVLDSMHVEQLWLPGHSVNWRTGEPSKTTHTNTLLMQVKGTIHTHCSAFAAAAAEKMGLYLLHPPEHSSVLLANAQQDWLRGAGTNQGWHAVSSPLLAQQLANQGQFVVVTYKNPDPDTPGHIAVVRPSIKDDQEILAHGPKIIQAGSHNYQSTSVEVGFRRALRHGQLLYFAHEIVWPSVVKQDGADKLGASAGNAIN